MLRMLGASEGRRGETVKDENIQERWRLKVPQLVRGCSVSLPGRAAAWVGLAEALRLMAA